MDERLQKLIFECAAKEKTDFEFGVAIYNHYNPPSERKEFYDKRREEHEKEQERKAHNKRVTNYSKKQLEDWNENQEKMKIDNQKKVAEADKEIIEENTPNIVKLNPLEK